MAPRDIDVLAYPFVLDLTIEQTDLIGSIKNPQIFKVDKRAFYHAFFFSDCVKYYPVMCEI